MILNYTSISLLYYLEVLRPISESIKICNNFYDTVQLGYFSVNSPQPCLTGELITLIIYDNASD